MGKPKRREVQEAWTAKAASRPRTTPGIPTTISRKDRLAAAQAAVKNRKDKKHVTR
jgi:hypothetical protein